MKTPTAYQVGDRIICTHPLYKGLKGKIFKIEKDTFLWWKRNVYCILWEDGETTREFDINFKRYQ